VSEIAETIVTDPTDFNYFLDHNLDINTRTIYLGSATQDTSNEDDGINGALTCQFLKNLHILNTINNEPITVIMNCIGGNNQDSFGIYDAIRLSPAPVTIKVFGQASSMASVILQAASERIMSSNSEMIIHAGSMSLTDNTLTVLRHADHEKKTMKKILYIYLERIKRKHPDYDIKTVKRMLGTETILTAPEVLKNGLCDKII
jgi:ATP-dependent Clp protease, protease subunit